MKHQGNGNFPKAIKSFIGYLEGTGKSEHTIKNYRLDLLAFQNFLNEEKQPPRLESLTHSHLEEFHKQLKGAGLKTNTRRRKLLTVQKFLRFLIQRKKLAIELSRKLPTPHKMERIPATFPSGEILERVRKLPAVTEIETRNRVFLWTLAETGCLVSEVKRIRFDELETKGTRPKLFISGKNSRTLLVSMELYQAVQVLKTKGTSPWLFLGFNKFGPMGLPMTSRGAEMLVRSYAAKLGFPALTPRAFRHSAAAAWLKEGISPGEVQARLGLKTDYAFRSYQQLLSRAAEMT